MKRSHFAKICTAINTGIVYFLTTFFSTEAKAITVDGNVSYRVSSNPASEQVVKLDRIVNDTWDTSFVDTTDANGHYKIDTNTPGISENNEIRIKPELKLFPNPSSSANISYTLSKEGKVSLKLYNKTGQLVKELINEEQEKGSHSLVFDGKDDNNNELANGIYFARLVTPDYSKTAKMIHIKGSGSSKILTANLSQIHSLSSQKSKSDTTYVLKVLGDSIYARADSLIIPNDTTINKLVIAKPNDAVEHAILQNLTPEKNYDILLDVCLLNALNKNKKIAIDATCDTYSFSSSFPDVLSNAMQNKDISDSDLQSILKNSDVRLIRPVEFSDSLNAYFIKMISDSIFDARLADDIDHNRYGGIADSLKDIVDVALDSLDNPTLLEYLHTISDTVSAWADRHDENNCAVTTSRIIPLANYHASDFNFNILAFWESAIRGPPYHRSANHEDPMVYDYDNGKLYIINSQNTHIWEWGTGWYFEPASSDSIMTIKLEYEQWKDRDNKWGAKKVFNYLCRASDIDWQYVASDYVAPTDTACKELVNTTINEGINDVLINLDKKVKSAIESPLGQQIRMKFYTDFTGGEYKTWACDSTTFEQKKLE